MSCLMRTALRVKFPEQQGKYREMRDNRTSGGGRLARVRAGRPATALGHVYPEPKFLDFAHHHGFIPRLCRPYRAKTNVPLASQLSLEGLKVDRDTANARVGTWLREVANARVHAIERCRYASVVCVVAKLVSVTWLKRLRLPWRCCRS
jgi:hypothetical protein